MKTIACFLLLLLPFVTFSQFSNSKLSPNSFTWKQVGDPLLGECSFPSLAFSPTGEPYLAYGYYSVGFSYETTIVKKFDGYNWDFVGGFGFTTMAGAYISLVFNPSGEPWITFSERTNDFFYEASVMKFNGNQWEYIGSPGFSDSCASFTNIAFNASGQPYVAYVDWGNSIQATVKKFDGNNWVNVGQQGFSAGEIDYMSLALNSNGEPYVAFEDYSNSARISVMKYDGTAWNYVGNPGFSTASVHYTKIAFGPTNQPYVAFQDFGHEGKATVMTFNGTDWVYVGQPGFTTGDAEYISLALKSDGSPYISFSDPGASVMRYDGTNWEYVGSPGFSSSIVDNPSLAFDQSQTPHIAYINYSNGHAISVMKYDSVLVGVDNSRGNTTLSLYPNPANTKLTINFKNEVMEISHLEIFDLGGRKIFETNTLESKITLDIEKFPHGIYFFKLRTSGSLYFERFCKN